MIPSSFLKAVAKVHELGRPDIFKADTRKYTDEELGILMQDESRPIFVAVDEADGETLLRELQRVIPDAAMIGYAAEREDQAIVVEG